MIHQIRGVAWAVLYKISPMITPDQFTDRIRACQSESEVEQNIHAWFMHVQGTPHELFKALEFAYDRRLAVRCPESGEMIVDNGTVNQ